MKKIGLLLILCCLFHEVAITQWNVDAKRDIKWYKPFPTQGGPLLEIDFTDTSLSQLPNYDTITHTSIYSLSNSTSICDTAGSLLMCCSGFDLYDSSYHLMQNGDSITPHFHSGACFAQNAIILPQPGHGSLYYVFTMGNNYPCGIDELSEVYYSIVDMNQNGGLGAVVSKANLILHKDSLANAHIKACRHGNGRDWWILIKDYYGNTYYRFLLDSIGLHIHTPQSVGEPFVLGNAWQADFSPTGDKYAVISGTGNVINSVESLNIFDFDRCTGLLSNPIQYSQWRTSSMNGNIYSICFSPNGQILYWSNEDSLFQYSLSSNQSVCVAVWDSTLVPAYYINLGLQNEVKFSFMKRGYDGRVYIGTQMEMMHYIDMPNLIGTACDVHQDAFQLPTSLAEFLINTPCYTTPPICPDGVEEIEQLEIGVYPNPTEGLLSIIGTSEGEKIIIVNLIGKVVSEVTCGNTSRSFGTEIDISELAKGVYLLILIDKNGLIIERKKITKQ